MTVFIILQFLQVSVGMNGNGGAGALPGVAGYPVAAPPSSVPYALTGIPYQLGYNYIQGLPTSVSCINPQMPLPVNVVLTVLTFRYSYLVTFHEQFDCHM